MSTIFIVIGAACFIIIYAYCYTFASIVVSGIWNHHFHFKHFRSRRCPTVQHIWVQTTIYHRKNQRSVWRAFYSKNNCNNESKKKNKIKMNAAMTKLESNGCVRTMDKKWFKFSNISLNAVHKFEQPPQYNRNIESGRWNKQERAEKWKGEHMGSTKTLQHFAWISFALCIQRLTSATRPFRRLLLYESFVSFCWIPFKHDLNITGKRFRHNRLVIMWY